jgi:hypothetical protein
MPAAIVNVSANVGYPLSRSEFMLPPQFEHRREEFMGRLEQIART